MACFVVALGQGEGCCANLYGRERMGKRRMSELVTIAAFRDVLLAHVALSKLESEGILCFLADEHIVNAQWLYSNAVGGVKLRVFGRDVKTARKLLADDEAFVAESEEEPAAAAPDLVCPHCGGGNVVQRNWTRIFAALSLLLSIPLPVFCRRFRCGDCGQAWRPVGYKSDREIFENSRGEKD